MSSYDTFLQMDEGIYKRETRKNNKSKSFKCGKYK